MSKSAAGTVLTKKSSTVDMDNSFYHTNIQDIYMIYLNLRLIQKTIKKKKKKLVVDARAINRNSVTSEYKLNQ